MRAASKVSRPAIEITEFIDRTLAGLTSTAGFRFGVLADMYIWGTNQLWADGEVRECLERCRDAGAAFVFVVGDLGTTETEVPRDGGSARLPDVFPETGSPLRSSRSAVNLWRMPWNDCG